MELIITAIALALAGLFVGILSGMLGVGGGTIIVPLLRLVFGLDAFASTATSLFTIIFTSVSGGVSHIRNRTCIWQLGLALGIGGAITSALGVYLGSISPSWAIMLVAAVIIIYSSYSMLKKALKMPRRGQKANKDASTVEQQDVSEWKPTARRLAGGFGIGLVAGLASGYVGVGGGFIMVPLMTAWLAVPMKKASGTSLMAIMILAIPGVIEQMLLGNVNYLAGICLVVGSIPGAIIGAQIVKRIPERELRFVFAAFLAVAAVMLVVKEVAL